MKIDKVDFTPDQAEGFVGGYPIRVASISVSCWACPKSWEGVTEDGRQVYVRYRWGAFRIDIDDVTVFHCREDEETEEEAKTKYAEMRKMKPSFLSVDDMEKSDTVMKKFMAENGFEGHSYKGDIEYSEIVRLTAGWFVWPEHETEQK